MDSKVSQQTQWSLCLGDKEGIKKINNNIFLKSKEKVLLCEKFHVIQV